MLYVDGIGMDGWDGYGYGWNNMTTLNKIMIITRPSIMCVTHQMSR